MFRRKAIISAVSLVELEELNSEVLEIVVILQQNTFTERHTSKTFDVLFSFTFFCWLQLKITGEQDFGFCFGKINSLILSQKGWENCVLGCQVWWLSALLQPPWPDQGSSSCSTAIRSFCMLRVSRWVLQRDRRIHLEKSSSIQIKPFFCRSESIIHRVAISCVFFTCLIIPTGSPTVASGPNVFFIVAWQTLNFKGRRDKERK